MYSIYVYNGQLQCKGGGGFRILYNTANPFVILCNHNVRQRNIA